MINLQQMGQKAETEKAVASQQGQRAEAGWTVLSSRPPGPKETPVAILHGDGVGLFHGVFPFPLLGVPLLEWALCLFAGWHKGGDGLSLHGRVVTF